MTLVVPTTWSERGAQRTLTAEPFEIIALDVERPGDVNRHRYRSTTAVAEVLERVHPDLLDLHEEPFSAVTRQWLSVAGALPVVSYTAQNVDKRFPPPFAQFEKRALERLNGIYACSRQAASVVRGKGFGGVVSVLPLGVEESLFSPGDQDLADPEIRLGLLGRLEPEKGVLEAVRVLAQVHRTRPARLVLMGQGSLADTAKDLARRLGVEQQLDMLGWADARGTAEVLRSLHVLLVPSKATDTWVEQFGRVIVEAQVSGAVVIAYASGAIPEVVGDAGVVVAEGDLPAMTAAVLDLVDPAGGRWPRLRELGLSSASRYRWDAIAAEQIAFYESALSSPPRHSSPGSPVVRRAAAEREFGPPARLRGGSPRPFALPVLRKDTALSRGLAAGLDLLSR